tara:strand:+ start:40 stop:384 length:345 start_codon:yes stop_codon:yes gene_type:complete
MADKKNKKTTPKKIPPSRIKSKITLKQKVKKRKASESAKETIYDTSMDGSRVSRVKSRLKNGKSTETFKEIKRKPNGTYTLSKCNKRGKCKTSKVSKLRGKFIQSRMKKKRDKL